MKRFSMVIGASVALVVAGCSTAPVALAPVGPNPASGRERMSAAGELQVFSRWEEESDNQNQGSTDPVWHQHADYKVYDAHGKLLLRVDNTTGHYEPAPRRVALPPGQYLVRVPAQGYLQVDVPVTIERGRLTRVHLDEKWKLPPATPRTEVVSTPNGQPVGWNAFLTKE